VVELTVSHTSSHIVHAKVTYLHHYIEAIQTMLYYGWNSFDLNMRLLQTKFLEVYHQNMIAEDVDNDDKITCFRPKNFWNESALRTVIGYGGAGIIQKGTIIGKPVAVKI
jgi:hypothetical protein